MIARISVSACALAQTLGSTDSAAVDAIKFAVGTGRLGLVRRSGASAAGRAVAGGAVAAPEETPSPVSTLK